MKYELKMRCEVCSESFVVVAGNPADFTALLKQYNADNWRCPICNKEQPSMLAKRARWQAIIN